MTVCPLFPYLEVKDPGDVTNPIIARYVLPREVVLELTSRDIIVYDNTLPEVASFVPAESLSQFRVYRFLKIQTF